MPVTICLCVCVSPKAVLEDGGRWEKEANNENNSQKDKGTESSK